jgi:hypothetical protein
MIEPTYEACIFGELAFPGHAPGAIESWRRTPLAEDAFDWPDAFRNETPDADDAVTIGRWIDDCARYQRSGARHFLEFTLGQTQVTLRGFLDGDEYASYRRQLVTMFRQASTAGAGGSLTLVSKPWKRFVFGYRVDVAPTGSSLRPLAASDLDALPDASVLHEIVARVKASPKERAISATRASLPRL